LAVGNLGGWPFTTGSFQVAQFGSSQQPFAAFGNVPNGDIHSPEIGDPKLPFEVADRRAT